MTESDKHRILLVEDDRGIQGLVNVLFSRRGFEVETVADGEQALRLLRDNDYSVILLDLMLPRVNGFEVVRELKALRPEVLQKIIVVTAASDLTLRDFDAKQVGRLMRKPFSIGELTAAVEQCINGDGLTKKRPPRRERGRRPEKSLLLQPKS